MTWNRKLLKISILFCGQPINGCPLLLHNYYKLRSKNPHFLKEIIKKFMEYNLDILGELCYTILS